MGIPEYTIPIVSVICSTLYVECSSYNIDLCFFSVARTTPLVALIPTEAAPEATAAKAYSICTNFPEGLKVVKENEYRSDAMIWLVDILMYLKWLRKCVKQCSNTSNNPMSCRKIFLFMNSPC